MTEGERRTTRRLAWLGSLALLAVGGCTTVPEKDYSAFRASMPRSILVLPPLNESVDAGASYSYLTVASEALGERGYYVFPVAVVDEFMKENGLPGPEEMHAVPLERIGEVIGADAVLYVTLEEFGQKFELLSSTTRVRARASLVDVASGQELWNGDVNHAVGSSSSGGGLLADLVTAAVTQAANTVSDRVHDAARVANGRLVASDGDGLLYGPRHPRFGTEEWAGAVEGAPGDAGAGAIVPTDDVPDGTELPDDAPDVTAPTDAPS